MRGTQRGRKGRKGADKLERGGGGEKPKVVRRGSGRDEGGDTDSTQFRTPSLLETNNSRSAVHSEASRFASPDP